VETEEEPGWAGLLAAYESQPRHQTNVLEIPEPADDPPMLAPVAVHGPVVAGAAAAAALAPELQTAPEPQPAPVVALAAVPEPEPASAADPESAFELQPEPWFDPEPEIEALEPEPDADTSFELRPEPWFGPEPEVEEESELLVRPAAQPTTAIDADTLTAMIVQHDLAVADSYFRPETSGEPEAASQPQLTSVRPGPSAARYEAETSTISSALVEASLIALAAVIATKLLKNPD